MASHGDLQGSLRLLQAMNIPWGQQVATLLAQGQKLVDILQAGVEVCLSVSTRFRWIRACLSPEVLTQTSLTAREWELVLIDRVFPAGLPNLSPGS